MKNETNSVENQADCKTYQVSITIPETDSISYVNSSTDISEFTDAYYKLKKEELFYYKELPNIIEKNPDITRFTTVMQFSESVSYYGTERVRLIKKALKIFINNIMPLEWKMHLWAFNNLSFEKFEKLMKKKYLLKHDSTPQDKLYYYLSKQEFTDKWLNKWRVMHVKFKKNLLRVKSLIRSIIKARNEIFMIMQNWSDFLYNEDFYESYGIKDFLALCKLSNNLSTLPQFKIRELLNLPTRESTSDIYNDWEISDVDD